MKREMTLFREEQGGSRKWHVSLANDGSGNFRRSENVFVGRDEADDVTHRGGYGG